ncbi:hypothetical protein FQN60_013142 [Etheostoma spectabile]|uniref:Uncharacterized protein n=1 Tax=Etheostoma spectabile TaxID=54343 RepID=A0A5J5D6U8_9PERO|nr:hypothetical protein FQN60_013142 [Etheostoma spectabile]
MSVLSWTVEARAQKKQLLIWKSCWTHLLRFEAFYHQSGCPLLIAAGERALYFYIRPAGDGRQTHRRTLS